MSNIVIDINRMIYDSNGHTGNSYYVYFVQKYSSWAWNNVSGAIEADPVRADIAIDLVEVGTSGRFPIRLPATLPTGKIYDVIVCKRAGSVPLSSDVVETSYVYSHGDIFGF